MDEVGRLRSAALRVEPNLRLSQAKPAAAIARKWVRVTGNWFAPEGLQLEDQLHDC